MSALIRIKAARTPYRRAGIDLNSASWTEVDLDDVGEERGRKLLADVNLTIQAPRGDGEWTTLSASVAGDGSGRAASPIEPDARLTDALDAIANLKAEIAARDSTYEKLTAELASRAKRIEALQSQVEQLTKDLAAAKTAAPTGAKAKAKGGGQAQTS